MKYSLQILLLILVQTALSQDTLTTRDAYPNKTSFRVSFQKGWAFPNVAGADQKDENLAASFGFNPNSSSWWSPSYHLYLTYADYYYQKSGLSGEKKDLHSVGFYPSIRIAKILLLGFGYSFGEKHTEEWYAFRADTAAFNGKYSRWSVLLALDYDIYIYRDFYFSVGIFTKEPVGFFALGLTKYF
ncbi:MAG: hypothetical protein HYZ01_01490 [Ignavibacteriales bacterium]|nr:hypothetical protein [Ignavibacteriales bacterium]